MVLADQLGVSVGDLFVGSLVPGVMLAGMYALYVVGVAVVRPEAAPALPPEERTEHGAALLSRVLRVNDPPLVLILLVLGSIFGIATPTEAGAPARSGPRSSPSSTAALPTRPCRAPCGRPPA